MSIELPAKTVVGEQEIAEGYYFEWLNGGKISSQRLVNSSVATMEAYFALNTQLIKVWDGKTPDYILIDLSQSKLMIDDSIRKRTSELLKLAKQRQMTGLLLFVIDKQGMSTPVRIFVNAMQRMIPSKQKVQFLTSRERALEMLRKELVHDYQHSA
jgi:hypothetical protein